MQKAESRRQKAEGRKQKAERAVWDCFRSERGKIFYFYFG
jgi:hypothetical protein